MIPIHRTQQILSSPSSAENLGYKGTVEEEPNQPPLTLCGVSDHITSSLVSNCCC